MNDTNNSIEEISIIGMSGRFPGALNINQFWRNLADGVESIFRFSDEELLSRGVSKEKINHPEYVKAGTILQDAEMFDAAFFGFNQQEAETMDPQQRVFLEIAWEALESAGYNSDSYDGAIGVFAGTSGNDYRKNFVANQLSITSGLDSFELMVGNDPDFFTTRVSYKLNLKGPSLTIQTACSSSLVAVHQACQSLLTYQCDMALAGGVCIRFPQGHGYMYQDGMIWSPDGHCRSFDAQAQGTLFGHGVGIVVLKRLSEALQDGDMILAVIKGSAINNDGSMKVGFTAPSVEGQAEVISTALALGNVTADTVSYIEAHGTGTPLGDPIEIEALTQSFREHTNRTGYCAIGSVKSNIGHLDTAAGVAGLIKTILALQHKKIPPSLHFTSPNPNIDFANSPFYVNNTLQEWQSVEQSRRAGVSSFGVGGTNAHVVLEEAPVLENIKSSRSWHLLPLSAKSETALQALTANLAVYLDNNPHLLLEDTAHTLQEGRKHFSHRSIAVCSSLEDAAQVLSLNESKRINTSVSPMFSRNVIFMFSGQGSQHVNMCRDLYQEHPFFKKQVDLCSQILQPHLGLDLRDILYPPENNIKEATQSITQTSITQPALFTIEYSFATLLNHLGIFPSALVGHSIGEYTAACIAGVFSLED
ncbi:type I polyketide synthase, partial [Thermodesulfobacteriota bacterium]